jgi:hypothetical protein
MLTDSNVPDWQGNAHKEVLKKLRAVAKAKGRSTQQMDHTAVFMTVQTINNANEAPSGCKFIHPYTAPQCLTFPSQTSYQALDNGST